MTCTVYAAIVSPFVFCRKVFIAQNAINIFFYFGFLLSVQNRHRWSRHEGISNVSVCHAAWNQCVMKSCRKVLHCGRVVECARATLLQSMWHTHCSAGTQSINAHTFSCDLQSVAEIVNRNILLANKNVLAKNGNDRNPKTHTRYFASFLSFRGYAGCWCVCVFVRKFHKSRKPTKKLIDYDIKCFALSNNND